MSDIFLSYAHADRDAARALAARLEQEGWSVWWDRKIPPGRSFSQVLEEALGSARCVVVLWSRASVGSDWVQTEAAEGRARGVLVPVRVEEAELPLEFKRIQAADLVGWREGSPGPEFAQFLEAVRRVLGEGGEGRSPQAAGPAAPEPEPAARPEGRSPLRASWFSWGRVPALAVFFGLVLVTLFRAAYPDTAVTDALTVIAVVSLLLAAGVDYGWKRWTRRRPGR
ncbi:MAG: hypothetical protein Kow0092_38860 [Deferrisomatales bacterium]